MVGDLASSCQVISKNNSFSSEILIVGDIQNHKNCRLGTNDSYDCWYRQPTGSHHQNASLSRRPDNCLRDIYKMLTKKARCILKTSLNMATWWCALGYQSPPLKNTSSPPNPISCQAPLKSAQTFQAPFFEQSPPLKSDFSVNRQNNKIFNP